MQKSFPPLVRLRCSLFRHRCTGEKSFASTGITPLIPLPPALPAKRGEQGEMEGGVVGGRLRRPPTTLFPCFPLPTPLCWGEKSFVPTGRGLGCGAISRWIGRLSNYPVLRKRKKLLHGYLGRCAKVFSAVGRSLCSLFRRRCMRGKSLAPTGETSFAQSGKNFCRVTESRTCPRASPEHAR